MSPPTQPVPSVPAITSKPGTNYNGNKATTLNRGPSEAEPSSSNINPETSPFAPLNAAEILCQESFGFDFTANAPHRVSSNSSNRNSHASSSTVAISPSNVAPTALPPAPEEVPQNPQESQVSEAKEWYERWIVRQQDPRPLKWTDAEYVELMWKLMAEQQHTAAQDGAAQESGTGKHQKKKRRFFCF